MKFEKYEDRLTVESFILFDEPYLFCGRPYIYMVAHKNNFHGWKAGEIGISIHDRDDFDKGLIYHTKEDQFFSVLHELVNWIQDHRQGICNTDILLSDLWEFFPDCGCERTQW